MTGSLELLDIERRIALFAQAITGAAYEVRATETFTGDDIVVRQDRAMLSSKALYLPAAIAASDDRQTNRRTYRLLSLHQLGYREFGTFEFRLPIAAERCATLADRIGARRARARIRFRCVLRTLRGTGAGAGIVPSDRSTSHRPADARSLSRRARGSSARSRSRAAPSSPADLHRCPERGARSDRALYARRRQRRPGSDRPDRLRRTCTELAATVRNIDADVYATAEAVASVYALLHVRGLIPPQMRRPKWRR